MQGSSRQWRRTGVLGALAIVMGVAACRDSSPVAPTSKGPGAAERYNGTISQGVLQYPFDHSRVPVGGTCGVTTIYGTQQGYSYWWTVNGFATGGGLPEFNLRNSGTNYTIAVAVTLPDYTVQYDTLPVIMGPDGIQCPVIYDDATGEPIITYKVRSN